MSAIHHQGLPTVTARIALIPVALCSSIGRSLLITKISDPIKKTPRPTEIPFSIHILPPILRGASATCPRSSPVEIHFPIDHVCLVAALAQKLHHLLA